MEEVLQMVEKLESPINYNFFLFCYSDKLNSIFRKNELFIEKNLFWGIELYRICLSEFQKGFYLLLIINYAGLPYLKIVEINVRVLKSIGFNYVTTINW